MNLPDLPLPLEGLRFKGDRDYLHGTDILPIALHALSRRQALDTIADIDVVFHAIARTGLTLCMEASPSIEPKVQLACSIEGVRRKFLLIEDGRPITGRHPYPEDQIIAATTIDADAATATSSATLPFTNIERWIAMVKALHHGMYPNVPGKWLFARAKLATYRDAYADRTEHRVSIKSDFGGKLTRSALTIDGRAIGDIYFALA
ncbi:MAG TPA: hypothetical protein VJU59_41930 [Paraburkholderia sp.]|uniref:hypothetical protein n=1 Tax=Paraburkholderia sp. TaxID=1926495 RepID=UPI002B49FC94|nr:hypothetical protein [Paraburkholderia sp.]HKR46154.1 hypothetical protein [Paraburkholderia sp.]